LPRARPLFVGTDSDARIIGADAGDDALAYTSLATAPALETVRARGPDLAAFALCSLFEAPFSLHDVDDARPLPALPDDPPDPYFAASVASGGVAVGAGAVAVGATVWAQQIRDAGLLSRSNADRAQRNVAIGVLDWTTGIAAGVGGAGAVVAASALFLRASE
jgi:hypothetical protein